MEIKILGPGCPRCKTLEKSVLNALTDLDIKANVSKVDDMLKILSYGIMHTPGLVINEKVVLSGRLPSNEEVKELIIKNR